MKLIIPLDEDQQSVCPAFGRTPWFLLWDTEQDAGEILPNPAAQAEGGAGLKAAQTVVDSGASVLLTPRCGENAAEVFRTAGIQIYKTGGPVAADNIAAYQAGELEKLTHFHAGYHGLR